MPCYLLMVKTTRVIIYLANLSTKQINVFKEQEKEPNLISKMCYLDNLREMRLTCYLSKQLLTIHIYSPDPYTTVL